MATPARSPVEWAMLTHTLSLAEVARMVPADVCYDPQFVTQRLSLTNNYSNLIMEANQVVELFMTRYFQRDSTDDLDHFIKILETNTGYISVLTNKLTEMVNDKLGCLAIRPDALRALFHQLYPRLIVISGKAIADWTAIFLPLVPVDHSLIETLVNFITDSPQALVDDNDHFFSGCLVKTIETIMNLPHYNRRESVIKQIVTFGVERKFDPIGRERKFLGYMGCPGYLVMYERFERKILAPPTIPKIPVTASTGTAGAATFIPDLASISLAEQEEIQMAHAIQESLRLSTTADEDRDQEFLDLLESTD